MLDVNYVYLYIFVKNALFQSPPHPIHHERGAHAFYIIYVDSTENRNILNAKLLNIRS